MERCVSFFVSFHNCPWVVVFQKNLGDISKRNNTGSLMRMRGTVRVGVSERKEVSEHCRLFHLLKYKKAMFYCSSRVGVYTYLIQ